MIGSEYFSSVRGCADRSHAGSYQESRDGQAKACDHILKETGLLQI